MSLEFNIIYAGVLTIFTFILIFFLNYLLKRESKTQLDKVFIIIFGLLIISIAPTILQMLLLNKVSKLIL